MSKTRFQFDVQDGRAEEVKALMRDIGAESNRELFNNALTLLEWAVAEVRNGNKIASVNDGKKVYRELQMPALNYASKRSADSGNSASRSRERVMHGY